jgi:hypothetical protein
LSIEALTAAQKSAVNKEGRVSWPFIFHRVLFPCGTGNGSDSGTAATPAPAAAAAPAAAPPAGKIAAGKKSGSKGSLPVLNVD